MAKSALDRVMDGLDIETFLVCENEEEGKRLAIQLMKELGFHHADVIFTQHFGGGVRIRARAVLNKPCDRYIWLKK